MEADARTLGLVRDFITGLYARPFDPALIADATRLACAFVGADYSSFFVFGEGEPSRPKTIVTNNPPGFLPIYFAVSKKDFLLDAVVNTAEDYVVRRSTDYLDPRNREFFQTVQEARPISDMVYSPLRLGGSLYGFWSMSLAGRGRPAFTDAQLDLLRFAKGFLNDAFGRSLLRVGAESCTAYLDAAGNLVGAGEEIREAFETLFGADLPRAGWRHCADARRRFFEAFRRFARGPASPGMDRLSLDCERGAFAFRFAPLAPLGPPDLPAPREGQPYAAVSLAGRGLPAGVDKARRIRALAAAYRFTPRECEVILGIYRGKSNKAIAYDLGIDESTVKRHTHNIYGKSGFASRVELVLGLFDTPAEGGLSSAPRSRP